ncbi:peptidase family M48-domain-containing protein [Mycena alexandri]|uniref:Peptidase family M48-domain-containing protein n=1 Tax=Mycena alexandri TaxID=1745969 RepID=A0AAD6STY4_9AGAR|nr:peptidase family M48-domain-containing protein [Mycena alexandri]
MKSLTRLSLESAPETGRRRFMAISEGEEAVLQRLALQETLEKYRGKILPLSHPLTQQVRRISRRIIVSSNLGHLEGEHPQQPLSVGPGAFAGLSAEIPRSPALRRDSEWVVLVVNDPQLVNAFAAPGLVCVFTGIVPIARNEAGLAAVIGHEIAHVTLRHSVELASQNKLLLPAIGLLFLLGIDPGLSSIVTQYLYSLPHSRALETEADIVGLKLMSRACYDPAAAPRFFEDLKRIEQSDVPKFLRTHPPTAERIAHLKTLLPQNYDIYKSSPECSRLEEMRSRGILGRTRIFKAVY